MDSQLATTKPQRAPTVMGESGVQFHTFDDLSRFCLAVSQSGLAPNSFKSPEAIMVAIQHGLEIGLAPMQALQGIAVINGKPTLYGDAALAVASAHPDFMDIEEWTEGDTAHCRIKRRNRTDVVRTFSDADARKAGLLGKSGPWTQYPQRMRQMRARAFALRDAFADALKGVRIREEESDIPVRAEVVHEPPAGLQFADEALPAPTTVPALDAPELPTEPPKTQTTNEKGEFVF